LPDKPINLTVTSITSRSAEISWLDPKNHGKYGLSNFSIELTKDNSLILNITTGRVNKYKINYLTPYTTYEISVAAGNRYGFDDGAISLFSTSEEGECCDRLCLIERVRFKTANLLNGNFVLKTF
jgi:hypothetical protein